MHDTPPPSHSAARHALPDVAAAARSAAQATLAGCAAAYDRRAALSRLHRLPSATIDTETPEAARAVVREIENALRRERARAGSWTYDLNRHIGLLVAYRAEKARLARLAGARGRG